MGSYKPPHGDIGEQLPMKSHAASEPFTRYSYLAFAFHRHLKLPSSTLSS